MNAEQVLYFFSYCLSDLINFGKRPKKVDFKTILVIKLDEIGDMIYAIPVFKLLKSRYPNSDLTLYCKKAASGLGDIVIVWISETTGSQLELLVTVSLTGYAPAFSYT